MLYLGWIVAAFLGGVLMALWFWQRKNRCTLRERFSQVESFRGRSYREVLTIAGTKPNTIVHQADGTTRRVWCEEGYFIALAFDAQDVCLGVIDEEG